MVTVTKKAGSQNWARCPECKRLIYGPTIELCATNIVLHYLREHRDLPEKGRMFPMDEARGLVSDVPLLAHEIEGES